MQKRRIVQSLLSGVIISILLLFFLHLFGSWTLSPDKLESGNFIIKMNVLDCYNECLLFDKTHQTIVYTESDKEDARHTLNNFKIVNSFKFVFDRHYLTLLLICLVTIPLSYLILSIKFFNSP